MLYKSEDAMKAAIGCSILFFALTIPSLSQEMQEIRPTDRLTLVSDAPVIRQTDICVFDTAKERLKWREKDAMDGEVFAGRQSLRALLEKDFLKEARQAMEQAAKAPVFSFNISVIR